MRAALDTLEIAKRLRGAGFSEPQAEVMTGVLRDAREADLSELATKADLTPLKADLAQLKADMTQLATKAELAQLDARLRAEIAALRSETEILRRDLTIRLGSMIVVATGVLLAAKFSGEPEQSARYSPAILPGILPGCASWPLTSLRASGDRRRKNDTSSTGGDAHALRQLPRHARQVGGPARHV